MVEIVLGALVVIGIFVFWCDVTDSWNNVFFGIRPESSNPPHFFSDKNASGAKGPPKSAHSSKTLCCNSSMPITPGDLSPNYYSLLPIRALVHGSTHAIG